MLLLPLLVLAVVAFKIAGGYILVPLGTGSVRTKVDSAVVARSVNNSTTRLLPTNVVMVELV
jgi:hypothetical protein